MGHAIFLPTLQQGQAITYLAMHVLFNVLMNQHIHVSYIYINKLVCQQLEMGGGTPRLRSH